MFDIGQHVGEMHGHTPSSSRSPLGEKGYQTKSIFEIPESLAAAIASNIHDQGFSALTWNNKQAYVVSEGVSGEVMVIYSYDHSFYLATLVNAPTPFAVFPEHAKA